MAEMEFRIPIAADSANTLVTAPLTCVSDGETVTLYLKAPDRSVTLSVADLAKFVRVVAAMATEEK